MVWYGMVCLRTYRDLSIRARNMERERGDHEVCMIPDVRRQTSGHLKSLSCNHHVMILLGDVDATDVGE